ncbi:MAG: LuxR C-terminal-related transcriptional regulator [Spirochaetia bacterium]
MRIIGIGRLIRNIRIVFFCVSFVSAIVPTSINILLHFAQPYSSVLLFILPWSMVFLLGICYLMLWIYTRPLLSWRDDQIGCIEPALTRLRHLPVFITGLHFFYNLYGALSLSIPALFILDMEISFFCQGWFVTIAWIIVMGVVMYAASKYIIHRFMRKNSEAETHIKNIKIKQFRIKWLIIILPFSIILLSVAMYILLAILLYDVSDHVTNKQLIVLIFGSGFASLLIFAFEMSYFLLWFSKREEPGTLLSIDLDICSGYGITQRERELISMLSQGLSNQEIAEKMFISIKTVKNHLHHIFQKTGAENRVQIINIFYRSR